MTSWTRRTALSAACTAAFSLPAAADTLTPVQSLPNISGTYQAEGRNPDGSAYSGQAAIVQNGPSVQMAWQVGAQAYSGQGVFDGRVLTVNWGDPHPVVYVLMPDGTLHGTWSNGRALERLRR